MSEQANVVKVFKDETTENVLKDSTTLFSVFGPEALELTKTVDKPDDYYVEGDSITFTISLKNVGDKRITNFVIKDELVSVVAPLYGDDYEVSTTSGVVVQASNPVTVSQITLNPGEESLIMITGVIRETE